MTLLYTQEIRSIGEHTVIPPGYFPGYDTGIGTRECHSIDEPHMYPRTRLYRRADGDTTPVDLVVTREPECVDQSVIILYQCIFTISEKRYESKLFVGVPGICSRNHSTENCL